MQKNAFFDKISNIWRNFVFSAGICAAVQGASQIYFFLQEFVQRETERLKFVTERAGGGKEKERVAVREEKPEVRART